jgi:hypothetical protein
MSVIIVMFNVTHHWLKSLDYQRAVRKLQKWLHQYKTATVTNCFIWHNKSEDYAFEVATQISPTCTILYKSYCFMKVIKRKIYSTRHIIFLYFVNHTLHWKAFQVKVTYPNEINTLYTIPDLWIICFLKHF